MVLDQAPWHRSRRVQQYLAAHPEFELIWLPAYTPGLNPVEFVGKLLKGRVVKGRYFANLEELKRAIRKFFVYLYTMPSSWRHLLRRFIPCYPQVDNHSCGPPRGILPSPWLVVHRQGDGSGGPPASWPARGTTV